MKWNFLISLIVMISFLAAGLVIFDQATEEVEAASNGWVWEDMDTVDEWATDIACGDCDNDGVDEVVVCTGIQMYNYIIAYEWDGVDWAKEYVHWESNWGYHSIAIGDADNDGLNEIVAGTDDSTNAICVWEKINGVWTDNGPGATHTTKINSVAIGDPDDDGRKEIVVGMDTTSSANLRLYEYNGGWTETSIKQLPAQVLSVAIGDIDDDSITDIVVGMETGITNEIRSYHDYLGYWYETNISDTPAGVQDLAIGSVETNEDTFILAGLNKSANELRTYTYFWSSWEEYNVTNVGENVTAVAIGDADNDGMNNLYYGANRTDGNYEFVNFHYDRFSYTWNKEEIDVNVQYPISGIAIGDIDDDGWNEAAIGMEGPIYNLECFYSDPEQDIVITSPKWDEHVTYKFEVQTMVNSDYVRKVNFYLNDTLVGVDSTAPYSCIIDTSYLNEGEYRVSAYAYTKYGEFFHDVIYVQVDHWIDREQYVNLTTPKTIYAPDQDVTAVVDISTNVRYDDLFLHVNLTDPLGHSKFISNVSYGMQKGILVDIPLASDTIPGEYTINVIGYGMELGQVVWKNHNQTKFTVSGINLYDHLDQINSSINDVWMMSDNIWMMINQINDTMSIRFDDLSFELMWLNDSISQRLDDMEGNLNWEIQNSVMVLTQLIEKVNMTLYNEILATMEPENVEQLRQWLEIVIPGLNDTINQKSDETQIKIDEINMAIDDLRIQLNESIGMLIADLADHDQQIKDELALIRADLGTDEGTDLTNLMIVLDVLEANLSENDQDILVEINSLRTLINEFRTAMEQDMDALGSSGDTADIAAINTQLEDLDKKVTSSDDKASSAESTVTFSMVLSVIALLVVVVLIVANVMMFIKSKNQASPENMPTDEVPKKEEVSDEDDLEEEEEE